MFSHARRLVTHLVLVTIALGIFPAIAFAQETISPPQQVRAFDAPSDAGGVIALVWSASPYDGPGVRYSIRMRESEEAARGPTQK